MLLRAAKARVDTAVQIGDLGEAAEVVLLNEALHSAHVGALPGHPDHGDFLTYGLPCGTDIPAAVAHTAPRIRRRWAGRPGSPRRTARRQRCAQ